LYAKDTVINYPVVQTKDNDYYLNHLFNRERNKCGCIFMDAANRSDFSSPNTILYGHHMRNGSMFGSLEKYKDKKYYKKHKTLLLMTKEKKYVIKIYAGYLCSQNGDAWRMDFTDEEDWNTWVQLGIDRSTFKNDIVPEYDDHVVTLSTCAYDFKNARYVLHGILEEKYD
jgi:sortase B